MLAGGHRRRPHEFVRIRGEAGTLAQVKQKKRVGLGLFALGDIGIHADPSARRAVGIQ